MKRHLSIDLLAQAVKRLFPAAKVGIGPVIEDGFYYDFDAFDDIQVSTGAHDITVPTSGVFLKPRGRSASPWRLRRACRSSRRK